MTDRIINSTTLRRWQGDRGTYHLVSVEGDEAEAIAMHERLNRLEFGARRGFGSVKVIARIGDTEWKTSVFPQNGKTEWIRLVSKKGMRAEDLAEGDEFKLELEPL